MKHKTFAQVYAAAMATIICQSAVVLYANGAMARDAGTPSAGPKNAQKQSPLASPEDPRVQAITTFNFKVPPGDLVKVLDDIAAQSGAKYRSEGAAIPRMQSPGVIGRMGLEEAVARALAGTGWTVTGFRNGEIRLAHATTGEHGGTTVSDIVVTARRQAFKENFSSAATLTNTSLRQTAATVDVVTQDVLESQNDYSLGDAVRNIPGAIFEAGGDPNQIVLGPETTAGATFTDGLRNGALADNEPMALVDSIEVVKGPASLLTGTQVGGGLLNYVPKRANGISPTTVSLGFGSGGEATGTADFSAAVPHVQNLYFRIIAQAQHADENPAGGNDPYQYVVSPMLGYRSDNTTVDLSYQYFNQRVPYARRDYIDGNGNIQSVGNIYNPDTHFVTSFNQFGYNIEQTLISSPDWTMKLRAKGIYQDGSREIAAAVPAIILPTLVAIVSVGEYTPTTTDSHHVDLYNKFSTGPLQHQLIVGGDYNLEDEHRGITDAVNFVAPNSNVPLPPLPYSAPRTDDRTEQYGVVFQDQINWGRLHGLAGLRGSWFTESTTPAGGGEATVDKSQKWTPSGGLVFDITKALSAYGSYTQAFAPQPAGTTTVAGVLLPPTLTTRYEGGFKSSLFADRLDVNISYYHATANNQAMIDPSNPLFYIPGPGTTENGVELSTTGSITPSLKVTAGYTHATGKQSDGQPPYDAPENVANLWLVKSFTLSNDSKLDLGFGGNYFDGYWLNPAAGTSDLVKFNRNSVAFDTSMGVTLGKLRYTLTIDNLLDRRNYALSGGTFQLERAEPRTFRMVVAVKF